MGRGGALVRTQDGMQTDARTLAAQIGLAKAMRQHDLRKIITFHSSVAKASRFTDAAVADSLVGVMQRMSPSSQPSGQLWTGHISGHTPAGKRSTLLTVFGNLPDTSRGVLSNCACLGEGVDVPVLDGVAFIDPKRSMIDIIQAVGRVIRKADDKRIGTVVIPVFVDESEDADHALSHSAFEPVWQVLKALRAHDQKLADELDELRLKLGERSGGGGKLRLPEKIKVDMPTLVLEDFERAFYVRTVERTTDKPLLTIEQILSWVDAHKVAAGKWPKLTSGKVTGADETWLGIDAALREGRRGLLGHSSLPKLLAGCRDVRNIMDLSPLTIKRILAWVDAHKASKGDWPNSESGKVADSDETWLGIDDSLRAGRRGLPGGSSLATLLAEHRSVRNLKGLPPLTIKQILAWADAHKAATGGWPNQFSGQVTDTDDTWHAIQHALLAGRRGFPGGSSLAKFLSEYRCVRNHYDLPDLTIKQILGWADAHKAVAGDWPRRNSGHVIGTDESWHRINSALQQGQRGLPGDSSLPKLLAKHRGVRNTQDLAPLSVNQVLAWIDAYKALTGDWPDPKSGRVAGTEETWAGINYSLVAGRRGFPGGSSLAKFLSEYRGVRNHYDLPDLTIQQILAWADEHKAATSNWPKLRSGQVTGTDETWMRVDGALRTGLRGLPGGSSLARLLADHCGVRNVHDLSDLTIKQILAWVDTHKAKTGNWPNRESGQVTSTNETWAGVNSALQQGLRSLSRGSSLAKFLAEHRGVRSKKDSPSLTIEQILAWADAHKAVTGHWPNVKSGPPNGTDETWRGINAALSRGNRGLPGGSSLPKLLAERRNVRNIMDLPPLTIQQILAWADTHRKATGQWPNQQSGQVTGTNETWSAINHSLNLGSRGLPSGSSLAKLLK